MEKKIGIFITGVTAFFLCAGYIWSRGYYSTFGIRVEYYFEISDYIKGSIDRVVWLLIFVVIGYGWGYLEKTAGGKKRPLMWYCIFLVVFSIVGLYSVVSGHWMRYFYLWMIPFLAIVVADEFMLRVNLEFYKKIRPYIWRPLLVALLFALLYGDGKTRGIIRMETDYQPKRATSIFTNNEVIEESDDHLFLGANSKYGFLYNKSANESVVIPLEKIKYFKISPVKEETTPPKEDNISAD